MVFTVMHGSGNIFGTYFLQNGESFNGHIFNLRGGGHYEPIAEINLMLNLIFQFKIITFSSAF